MPGMGTGRIGFVFGLVAGISAWLLTVGVIATSSPSIYDVLSFRSIGGDLGIVFVLTAAVLYYFREHSLTRTAYSGFFFGFAIGFGILAITTDPAI